jgi:Flp pilus assembly pilin Flp
MTALNSLPEDFEVTIVLRNFMHLLRREEGQSLVEYVLIIALVSIVLVVALNQLGAAIVNVRLRRLWPCSSR